LRAGSNNKKEALTEFETGKQLEAKGISVLAAVQRQREAWSMSGPAKKEMS